MQSNAAYANAQWLLYLLFLWYYRTAAYTLLTRYLPTHYSDQTLT
jgi:hypothetical protein